MITVLSPRSKVSSWCCIWAMFKARRIAASQPECFSKQDKSRRSSNFRTVGSGNPQSAKSRRDGIYEMAWPQHAIVGHIPPRNTSTLTHLFLLSHNPHTSISICKTTHFTLHTYYTAQHGNLIGKPPKAPPTNPDIADHQQQQLMKAAFPMGFISMEPKSHNSSISTNMTQKALKPSGAVNQGNDTYNFYDGDGGDGWPSMDKWVDFYSM